uniref:Putative secreted protein n=1 Tax=Anopheles triannulatus TaxID=58253 RepID=A0A2M4B2V1_9DIPT
MPLVFFFFCTVFVRSTLLRPCFPFPQTFCECTGHTSIYMDDLAWTPEVTHATRCSLYPFIFAALLRSASPSFHRFSRTIRFPVCACAYVPQPLCP